jgi:hypothetical protein
LGEFYFRGSYALKIGLVSENLPAVLFTIFSEMLLSPTGRSIPIAHIISKGITQDMIKVAMRSYLLFVVSDQRGTLIPMYQYVLAAFKKSYEMYFWDIPTSNAWLAERGLAPLHKTGKELWLFEPGNYSPHWKAIRQEKLKSPACK